MIAGGELTFTCNAEGASGMRISQAKRLLHDAPLESVYKYTGKVNS